MDVLSFLSHPASAAGVGELEADDPRCEEGGRESGDIRSALACLTSGAPRASRMKFWGGNPPIQAPVCHCPSISQ